MSVEVSTASLSALLEPQFGLADEIPPANSALPAELDELASMEALTCDEESLVPARGETRGVGPSSAISPSSLPSCCVMDNLG